MTQTFDSIFYKEVGYDELSKKYKQEYMEINMIKRLMLTLLNKNWECYKEYISISIRSIDGIKIKKIDPTYIHVTYYKRFLKKILKKDKDKKQYLDFSYLDPYILEFIDTLFLHLCQIINDDDFKNRYEKYIDIKYLPVFVKILKSVNDKNKPYIIITT